MLLLTDKGKNMGIDDGRLRETISLNADPADISRNPGATALG
jgi:hypothetical protein